MKQRITGLDLQIITGELTKSISNYRLQNIYNIASSSRRFLFKFSVPDSKKLMVLDCGNSVHLTEFERPTSPTPSNFVTKLRKHLKTRRLSGIKQIGNDRVLVLEFSDGMYYLVFEFFSAGNILLLDADNKILSLQRMVSEKGDNDRYAVNETYKMFDRSLFTTEFKHTKRSYTTSEIKDWIQTHRKKLEDNTTAKKNKVYSIHKLLFVNASHLSSDLILKNLNDLGITTSSSCLEFESDEEKLNSVVEALEKSENDFLALLSDKNDREISGCIVSKRNASFTPTDDPNEENLEFVYDEFHPFEPFKKNAEDYKFTQIEGYNKTLDTFFSALESTKYALKIEQQKQNATKRLENARQERDKQIQSLVQQQEANSKKGDSIIFHADLVNSCREAVQSLLDKQMDWTNIETIIKHESSRGNKIMSHIKLPLNLKENKINLLLTDMDHVSFSDNEESESDANSTASNSGSDSESETESEYESEDSDPEDSDSDSDSDLEMTRKKAKGPKKVVKKKSKREEAPKLSVWIDLALSPYANARLYFDSKKSAEIKKVKVEKNTGLALKNAERKIAQDLAHNLKNEHDTLQQIRPKYWFEKFYWFVSSEGYLCLAGRDNSQIDMIYYRHFNDNDFVVSSDTAGSLKVFIKNPFKGEGVPPSTLWQAGIFAMSASTAWNGKVSTSAWWLHGSDISKKDFDGSLLSPGDFYLKSKKEYMPAAQMVMGFGFYILVDEDTTSKYKEVRSAKEVEHGLKITMDNKKKDLEELIQQLESKESAEPSVAEKVEEPVVETDKHNGAEIPRDEDTSDTESLQSSLATVDLKSSKKPVKVRGKKAKMKKIAAKYADQDDEERRLRMSALGTLQQIDQIQKQKEEERVLAAEREKSKYQESAAVQRRKKEQKRELQRYLEDENEDESSISNYLDILDSLVAKPQPGDGIVAIVPVFAPWSSLQKLKYKVKIQPGSGKKGKCINDSINYFTNRKSDSSSTDTDLDWPQERELIKVAKPNDLVGVFTVSKVKLVLPGGQDGKKPSAKKATPKKGKK
ncbi:uncharacterized protein RJT20DRAFT_137961 [Scheffersomyces xylosifermentans]|uniref:uncharacterized protein n=1 Tax=Scheffersomyces xylosifermentans TaxID=1304137 RepID=UPI00315DD880